MLTITSLMLPTILCRSTAVGSSRRRDFYESLKCAAPDKKDVKDSTLIVYLYKPGVGLVANKNGAPAWTTHDLTGEPTPHKMICNRRFICTVKIDEEYNAEFLDKTIGTNKSDLYLTVQGLRHLSYTRYSRKRNIIKYYSKNKVLVFFDRFTRRYLWHLNIIALNKISSC